ncbi:MAG: IclR family transcriptional regulator [Negativicutes bacterium]
MNSSEKVIWLLKKMGNKPYEFSLQELANEMNVGKSGVYKILAVLQKEGFVARKGDTKKYSLGSALYGLGILYNEIKGLSGVAESIMQKVSIETRETVSLGIREGDDAILLSKIESPHAIRLFGKVGQKYPYNAGAIGKLLAAFHDPKRIDQLLSQTALIKKTPHTIVELSELKCEYEKIRTQGFAISDSENAPGAFGISTPIRDKNGNVFACICIAGPKERFTTQKIQEWTPLLVIAGNEISNKITGLNSR